MLYLVQKKVDGSTLARWLIGDIPLVAGRGDQAVARFDDREASRQHFSIKSDGGKITLKDLGSQNGTWVSGNRITEAEIKLRDTIRAGETNFTLEEDTPAEGATMIHAHAPKKLRLA